MSSRDPRHLLQPRVLIDAYSRGLFPMGMPDGSLGWFSPDPRALIPLDDRFRITRSLRQSLKRVERGELQVRFDTAFREVMLGCADRESTWISGQILDAYCQLAGLGVGHSVEVWEGGQLVGGLYGLALRGAFFGESMFSRVRDASKIALVHLVLHMRRQNMVLLDTQWLTPHLETFGAYAIPRAEYLSQLRDALSREAGW